MSRCDVRIRLRRPVYPPPTRRLVLWTSEGLCCLFPLAYSDVMFLLLERVAIRPTLSRRARVLHIAARFCSRNGRCLTCLSIACRSGDQDRSQLSIRPSEFCLDIDRSSGERCWSTPGPTTAAAIRLPREALFSFSAAAILRALVNEMPLSAFIRWTFFSSNHLGQSLL